MQLWTYFTKQWQHRVQLGFLLRLGQGVRRRDVLVEQLLEVGQAQQLESAVLKLHTSWRRLGGLQERLWVESGSSTPHLRELLTALQSLSGSTLRVSLGELAGGKRVRLQLVEESPEQLDPPQFTPDPASGGR